jgi:hypothetical protein
LGAVVNAATLSFAGIAVAPPLVVADVRKELGAIMDEAELKTADPVEIKAGVDADTPDTTSKAALALSLPPELGVTFSIKDWMAAGNSSVLSDATFTANGAVAATRTSAAGKCACKNCAGIATGTIVVGEAAGYAVAAVAVVVHVDILGPLPFLPEGCPSRDFSETAPGRCRISCTSPANDATGAEEFAFAAVVPDGAEFPGVTGTMSTFELETGCMQSGRTAEVRGCNYVSNAAAGAALSGPIANTRKQSR